MNRKMLASCAALALVLGFSSLAEAGCSPEEAQQKALTFSQVIQEESQKNPENYALISPNLFRVQALTKKDYKFRHHLETTVVDINSLRDITWKRIRNENGLKGIVKVRINHIGQIVAVGEY